MTALSLVHALRPPAPGANAEGERPRIQGRRRCVLIGDGDGLVAAAPADSVAHGRTRTGDG